MELKRLKKELYLVETWTFLFNFNDSKNHPWYCRWISLRKTFPHEGYPGQPSHTIENGRTSRDNCLPVHTLRTLFCFVVVLRRTCDAFRTVQHSRFNVGFASHFSKSSDVDLVCLSATEFPIPRTDTLALCLSYFHICAKTVKSIPPTTENWLRKLFIYSLNDNTSTEDKHETNHINNKYNDTNTDTRKLHNL